MPDDSVTPLDVQFGHLDVCSDSSVTFNSSMHANASGDMLYGNSSTKMDSYSGVTEKDQNNVGVSPSSQNSFQNQRNSQSSLVDSSKGLSSGGLPISPNIDSHSLSLSQQTQSKSQSYGNVNASASGPVSAFASYKGAPGFPAPGFPPVTQAVQGPGTYNSAPTVVGGASTYVPQQNSIPNQSGGYNIGGLSFGAQPVVSTVNSQLPPQSGMPSVSQNQAQNSSYGSSAPPQSAYHHNTNSNSGYVFRSCAYFFI